MDENNELQEVATSQLNVQKKGLAPLALGLL